MTDDELKEIGITLVTTFVTAAIESQARQAEAAERIAQALERIAPPTPLGETSFASIWLPPGAPR